ncbi:hypothetical protein ID866_7944 [Astraeus odoratus]|nr:hypothetical protein ID866_7944 [Astraeus odoratus]
MRQARLFSNRLYLLNNSTFILSLLVSLRRNSSRTTQASGAGSELK